MYVRDLSRVLIFQKSGTYGGNELFHYCETTVDVFHCIFLALFNCVSQTHYPMSRVPYNCFLVSSTTLVGIASFFNSRACNNPYELIQFLPTFPQECPQLLILRATMSCCVSLTSLLP